MRKARVPHWDNTLTILRPGHFIVSCRKGLIKMIYLKSSNITLAYLYGKFVHSLELRPCGKHFAYSFVYTYGLHSVVKFEFNVS